MNVGGRAAPHARRTARPPGAHRHRRLARKSRPRRGRPRAAPALWTALRAAGGQTPARDAAAAGRTGTRRRAERASPCGIRGEIVSPSGAVVAQPRRGRDGRGGQTRRTRPTSRRLRGDGVSAARSVRRRRRSTDTGADRPAHADAPNASDRGEDPLRNLRRHAFGAGGAQPTRSRDRERKDPPYARDLAQDPRRDVRRSDAGRAQQTRGRRPRGAPNTPELAQCPQRCFRRGVERPAHAALSRRAGWMAGSEARPRVPTSPGAVDRRVQRRRL